MTYKHYLAAFFIVLFAVFVVHSYLLFDVFADLNIVGFLVSIEDINANHPAYFLVGVVDISALYLASLFAVAVYMRLFSTKKVELQILIFMQVLFTLDMLWGNFTYRRLPDEFTVYTFQHFLGQLTSFVCIFLAYLTIRSILKWRDKPANKSEVA